MFLFVKAYRSVNINTKIIDFSLIVILWSLFIISGYRKELFAFIMCLFLSGFVNIGHHKKSIIALVLLFLALPIFRDGNFRITNFVLSFHEFVLPQYTQGLVEFKMSHSDISYILRNSSLINGIGALFPSFLRLLPYKPIGVSILDLPYVDVGLGIHPFAEYAINFGKDWWFFFIIVSFIGYNLVFYLSRWIPEILFVSLGYFAMYGRSDVWLTIFFVTYSSIVLMFISRRVVFKV